MLIDHTTDTLVFLQARLGGDRNFCYLLGDRKTGEAAVVDPGFAAQDVLDLASGRDLEIRHILVTHGHSDHVGAVSAVMAATGAKVYAGEADHVPAAVSVADGQEIAIGNLMIRALATPGHSPGHFCYLCEGLLCTGDLLFCGKVGGTGEYFPGSSAEGEWASLHRLLELPDRTRVFPGHDYYGGEGRMPHSTIGFERINNPFLTCQDFVAFIHLKENWSTYKEEHNIR